MKKPHPKFCVGEEVSVVSKSYPEINTPRVEVIKVTWRDKPRAKGGDIQPSQWIYTTAHLPSSGLSQRVLRKLPPESGKFDALIDSLNINEGVDL
jgi:hypothetical protein